MSERKIKIEVKSLTKSFEDLLVLDDINFHVYEGELLCIVGPTGCGKTTFLNLLSKLTSPTKGDVLIDGEPANPRKHNISFVFQEPSCLPWRTIRDDVKIGLEIKKYPNKTIDNKTDEIMKFIGLDEVANFYPHQISAGMKQRVAIARAFVVEPDLLLMDEPFGHLDIKLRFFLEDEVVKMWRKYKRTIIFVTHNLEEAVYIAERVLVLTQKPTHVKAEIPVNLSRPRDYTSTEFVKIREQITDLVKWW
jgi:sulfonate transport system ATP-binding protein